MSNRTRKPWTKRKFVNELRRNGEWIPVDGMPWKHVSKYDVRVIFDVDKYIPGQGFAWEVWAAKKELPPTKRPA